MLTIDEFTRKAVGVPFVEQGRDYSGWDCWGLCVRAYQDILGVTLPDFRYSDENKYRVLMQNFEARRDDYWRDASDADMSVACIYRRGHVIHAGLRLGKKILHVEEGVETCLEPISKIRIEGFYEPACLTAASI